MLVAAYIIENQTSDEIEPYLTEGIESLISEILRDREEAEGLTLLVVPVVLKIQVVQYMLFDRILVEKFPNESVSTIQIPIIIKVRGHYDILYPAVHCARDGYDLATGSYSLK